jgi:hypothetical protein
MNKDIEESFLNIFAWLILSKVMQKGFLVVSE